MLRFSAIWSHPRFCIKLPSASYHFSILDLNSYYSLCLIMPSPVFISFSQNHFKCHLFKKSIRFLQPQILLKLNFFVFAFSLLLQFVSECLERDNFPSFIFLSPPAWNLTCGRIQYIFVGLKQRAKKMSIYEVGIIATYFIGWL